MGDARKYLLLIFDADEKEGGLLKTTISHAKPDIWGLTKGML
jgi:hypothetical protein